MADTATNDPRDELKNLIGGYPHAVRGKLPELDASLEEIAQSGLFDHLKSKADYLAWVQQYKRTIKFSEAHLRELKSLRKTGDIWEKSGRMERQAYVAKYVTVAIHMRRLGKVWSAAQKAALEQAA